MLRKEAHTVSTSRILSREEFQQIQKGKAAKVVEGTTKGKKHTEEETDQLKQILKFVSELSISDPAFRSCYSNITLLKFYD
jgi:translation elongation factor EF-4